MQTILVPFRIPMHKIAQDVGCGKALSSASLNERLPQPLLDAYPYSGIFRRHQRHNTTWMHVCVSKKHGVTKIIFLATGRHPEERIYALQYVLFR